MISPFNSLESAVLKAIAEQYPEQKSAILAQFNAASVVARENTEGGFFVDLEVDQENTEPVTASSPIGYVFADISGFMCPMCFHVSLKQGYAELFEGYCQGDDDTLTVDFEEVEFTVCDFTSAA